MLIQEAIFPDFEDEVVKPDTSKVEDENETEEKELPAENTTVSRRTNRRNRNRN